MARNELESAEEAFRAAQSRLGIVGAYIALINFTTKVGALNPVATGAQWTALVVRLVASMRIRSRKLAQSYYQLARAIDTGFTLGVPEGDEPSSDVSLGRLRQRFLDELLEVNSLGKEVSDGLEDIERFLGDEAVKLDPDSDVESRRGAPLSRVKLDSYIQSFLDHEGADGLVEVEPFEWPTDTDFNVIEETLGDYVRRRLDSLEKDLKSRVKKPDDNSSPEELDKKLSKAHEDAGNDLAGDVHKQGIDAGSTLIRKVSGVDKRVQVWARVTGPRPCAFCAMLASRGFAYKTKQSATGSYKGDYTENADGSLNFSISAYHKNCACTAVPRWESVHENDTPELNAYLEKMWPEVTAAYSGVDALNAWRRWLNAQYSKTDGQQSFDFK